MKTRSVSFLTEFAEQKNDSGELVIPTDLTTLSLEELQELRTKAEDSFNAIYETGMGAKFAADDIELLKVLSSGIESLTSAIDEHEAAAAALKAQAQELAAQIRQDEAPAEEEAPAEAEVPVVEELATEEEAEPEPEAPKELRIDLSKLATRAKAPKPAPEPEPEAPDMRSIMKAASGGQGFAAGQGMNWDEAGKLLNQKMQGFNETQYAAARRSGKHIRQEFGILSIQKPIPSDLIVRSNDPMEIDAVLRRAMDEKRLPEGSLVAAGGWCAPSETIYTMCELETNSGLFDLPEIGMARGGINRTLGPDFASLYANTGFCYTAAEVEEGQWGEDPGDPKPCYALECPDFEDIRMGVCGLCITAGLMQARGYPELLARVLRGALVAHNHKLSSTLLNQAEAGSTAVNLAYMAGLGAAAPILESIELQVTHMRYINRLSDTATVEAVFPYWVRGVIRADLALRAGVDLLSVPDSRINGWFRERGIAAQFVYNWQDLTGPAGGFTKWPSTVKFLLYPAGTWVKGAMDVINITNVHDSINLGQNEFTALFTEEGIVAAKMCHDSRVVTVPLCRNGATGNGIDIDCATGGVVIPTPPGGEG